MINPRRLKRKAIAASCLALDLTEYDATRNPVFLWEAIAECLHSGLPLPPAVIDYLKRVSARFTKLSRGEIPKKGQIVRALATALEFPTGRATGARNPFMHLADTEHELMIAFEVLHQFREGHTKEDSAYQRVVETHPLTCSRPKKCRRISRSTVRACWKKHGHLYRPFLKKVSD
jgi:hypothetical protein